ncbi:MAG TPA: PIN domain-containing protein [Thermoanaerobaculia bacterium]|jgi:predicted nucleic acid-binding protein
MASPRILIDTGAIYAFVTRTDPHHEAAKRFVREWLRQKGVFVLPDVVFAETMTLLKARVGPEVALRVGRELRQNAAYAWLVLGIEAERETWAVFQRFTDKDWSYTDCAVLALARREKIPLVFAFDRHFLQMPGIKRVPK